MSKCVLHVQRNPLKHVYLESIWKNTIHLQPNISTTIKTQLCLQYKFVYAVCYIEQRSIFFIFLLRLFCELLCIVLVGLKVRANNLQLEFEF